MCHCPAAGSGHVPQEPFRCRLFSVSAAFPSCTCVLSPLPIHKHKASFWVAWQLAGGIWDGKDVSTQIWFSFQVAVCSA